MAAPEVAPELLAVVLDARLAWLRAPAAGPAGPPVRAEPEAEAASALPCVWDALLVLCRAHATLGPDQRVAVLGATSHRAALLAQGVGEDADWAEGARAAAAGLVLEDGSAGSPLISVALSSALCYASRLRGQQGKLLVRVLLVDASAHAADLAAQNTALTGCAFAALAEGAPVDCLSLGPEPSALLRQVSILTGGKHHALPATGRGRPLAEVLVPTLLFHFLPGVAVRKQLAATEDVQTLAAICACHGEAQKIAFVCSSCLAIYCSDERAICAVCRTRFRQDSDFDPRLRDLDPETVLGAPRL